jgi:hypothetical protein
LALTLENGIKQFIMIIVSPWFSRFSLAVSVGVLGATCLAPAAVSQTASQTAISQDAPAAAAPDTTSSSASLSLPDAPGTPAASALPANTNPSVDFLNSGDDPKASPDDQYKEGQQTKRILFIIPNFRSVSVDARLKPLTPKEKFGLAFSDSFDYSSFIYVGMLAGVGMAENATPEFHQGAAGYGRYYWHSFADNTIGNFMTEAIVPIITREDPRYYTLGRGGLFKRTYYAVSRLLITRTDADPDKNTFNISEVVGNGAASGIAYFYYPSEERNWTKVGQRWLLQIGLDGMSNVVKEFWPDVAHGLFHASKASVAPEGSTPPPAAAPTPAPKPQQ